jgi:phage terminase large subunit
MSEPRAAEGVTLYRFVAADDTLLYVGVTRTGLQRVRGHASKAPWWPLVARATFEHGRTLADERTAIELERPLFNVEHTDRADWLDAMHDAVASGFYTEPTVLDREMQPPARGDRAPDGSDRRGGAHQPRRRAAGPARGDRAMTTGTLEHVYTPRGACHALFADRRPEVLLSGPAGTGKSRACLEKLHLLALLNPGMRGLIVRKTLASLASTALVTWREHVAAEALATRDVTYYGGSSEEPPQYRYSNGSRIMIGGMDKATRVMSSEYDVIYVQEAIELTEGDWEALTTRLRNGRLTFQQLVADTNPDTPTHWLKARADRGATVMLESRHDDNPLLYDDTGELTDVGAAYIARLDALTGPRRDRLRRGLWTSAEGQIYEGWDPAVHMVDRRFPPKDWTRWWVVDFGFTNPFVLQRWAIDHDGRAWMYAERYLTRTLVEDHARAVLAEVAPDGEWREPKPRAVICDHDAEDRATLERHLGIGTIAATKTVKPGLEAVMARMRPAGDGKPRLFISRDARRHPADPELADSKKPTCTAEEIPGYIWAPAIDGRPVKEDPVKVDDHGCDAMRYLVAELDLAARPRIRML